MGRSGKLWVYPQRQAEPVDGLAPGGMIGPSSGHEVIELWDLNTAHGARDLRRPDVVARTHEQEPRVNGSVSCGELRRVAPLANPAVSADTPSGVRHRIVVRVDHPALDGAQVVREEEREGPRDADGTAPGVTDRAAVGAACILDDDRSSGPARAPQQMNRQHRPVPVPLEHERVCADVHQDGPKPCLSHRKQRGRPPHQGQSPRLLERARPSRPGPSASRGVRSSQSSRRQRAWSRSHRPRHAQTRALDGPSSASRSRAYRYRRRFLLDRSD